MKVEYADRCGWTAVYLSIQTKRWGKIQVAHLGLDPNIGGKEYPELYGGIAGRKDCTGGRKATWSFRVKLPHVPWKGISQFNSDFTARLYFLAYRFSNWFYRRFDQRYRTKTTGKLFGADGK